MRKNKELEKLASNMIGDGKKPNLFFVSVKGVIVTVTKDFEMAYNQWFDLSGAKDKETALEDRQVGILASVQPISEHVKFPLEIIDDTRLFRHRKFGI